jgi:glutamate-1-semialdehyde aminotransferase
MSIAAGSATLTILETTDALERANKAGERLRTGLRHVLRSRGYQAAVTGVDSIVQLHMGVNEVNCRRDSLNGDRALTADVMLGCVANGVLWPPIHPAVTSSEHSDADIDRVLEVVDSVLARLAHNR